MVNKILIVVNPKAGRARAEEKLDLIIEKLNNKGYDLVTYITEPISFDEDIEEFIKDDYYLILCLGGDGTLSLLVNVLKKNDKDIPILYIPSGTANDFANSHNMTKDTLEQLDNIESMNICYHDVAKVNDRYFNYVLAFGALVDASSKTSRKAKNMFGSISYVFRAIKEVKNIKKFKCKIQIDDVLIEDEYVLVMVANSKYIGGFKLPQVEKVRHDDGIFEIYLYKLPNNISTWLNAAGDMVSKNCPKDIEIYRGSNIKIEILDEGVSKTIDGEEIELGTSLNVEVIKKRIKVFKLMGNFEKKYSKYAIQNLMYYLIVIYALGIAIWYFDPMIYIQYLSLDFTKVASFQIWRLITFMMYPIEGNIIIALLLLYIYYSVGKSIESLIGAFRFNIFIFGGIFFTILLNLIFHIVTGQMLILVSNAYINLSIFLMLSLLNPDQTFLFYFVLPIKAKWFAFITLGFFGLAIYENIFSRIPAIAALINVAVYFLIFELSNFRYRRNRSKFRKNVEIVREKHIANEEIPKHKCYICGKTDVSNPELEFRYCSKCSKMKEYCSEHIHDHEHK